jgi:6-phosphofructokinase 1
MHIITKEAPYDLKTIAEKIETFRKTGKQHFIIVISEGVGNSEGIAQAITAMTGIESRATILGHVQRGGSPTVRDRVTATQMGHYAVELLSKGYGNRVVAIRDGKIADLSIEDALKMEKPFDLDLYNIAQEISF